MREEYQLWVNRGTGWELYGFFATAAKARVRDELDDPGVVCRVVKVEVVAP